ncbi:hypothetical protein [Undibacter mobilis]|uniref:Uncharacterized protein n=1 Tax=Undibacter mobilis TaxID=2292256 RepID=A0A371BAW2_9BRAD|nr:hypothetical protein [Undibacter mobilis]RDV04501.1 hypothetical protein DXH78_07955 [Undibacter mobilis]
MTSAKQHEKMDAKARAFIDKKFAHAPLLKAEMTELWQEFLSLKLPSTDFMAEFINGKQASLTQRTWEMMLARHLSRLRYVIACPDGGPDFSFELNGTKVWVEAVAPLPKGLSADWLDPNFQGVQHFPHEAILLRWMTAFNAKWKKLLGYQQKGIVRPNDAYVIAINGRMLGAFPETSGITRMPFGLETTFPVGPLAHRMNPETALLGPAFISERYAIPNANEAEVPTTPFLDLAYEGVSALIGSSSDRTNGKPLDLHVVHNPLARVRLPLGSLGGQENEWFASPVADTGEFDLQQAGHAGEQL